MSVIVSEETHKVTVKRIEHHDGEVTYDCVVDGEMSSWGRHRPRVRLDIPERQPLMELAWKGRYNALKELP